jgi:ABC-type antimicrobial peptide transport system permease subunit
MNLSTAQSERRAREVGIRKTIGSARGQLIQQFLFESLLVVVFAYLVALTIVTASLPWFNLMAGKEMQWPLTNIYFWLASASFILTTSAIAGSYPALYLSSFQPVKVLKGTFRAGKSASFPRKVLVVAQFTVSIALIIGTIIVWQQIEFVKNRPIGYSRDGLIMIRKTSPEIYQKTDVLARELKATGAVSEIAESSNPATEIWFTNKGFTWKGKDPNLEEEFVTMGVTHDYGKTVGWKFLQGRDFSRSFSLDSSGTILNETAVKYLGLTDPLNEEISWNGKSYHVIGVIQDMIMGSPYEPVKQTLFYFTDKEKYLITLRLNSTLSSSESLKRIEKVFQTLLPSVPFDFKFADAEYATKFAAEERVGRLASLFASLAIFISCLGLFGMASFVAEQRRKEIGIRKVMGASVSGLWKMLSIEFLQLVTIACLLGIPLAWNFLKQWLDQYAYHTPIELWVFAAASAGALLITLVTVSFQTLRASTSNPVTALRSE